jgi:hypothetical protein
VAVRLVTLGHPYRVSASTITARDPGWADQLLPIVIGSAVVVGSLASRQAGSGASPSRPGCGYRHRRCGPVLRQANLADLSTHIVATDGSGTHELDVSDLIRIEAGEVFHVGKRVDLIAPRDALGDVDPGSARHFLLAVGKRLADLGMQDICSPAARPFLGL